ncbi:MAG: hypothetical protein ACI9R3_001900, partial [Verrucomicrobiales bacterium]
MLAPFLDQLFESGRIQLATSRPLQTAETAAIDRLKEEETAWRNDFPGAAPGFSLDASYWAAGIVYRAAQFFSARDLPAEAVYADLSTPCPLASNTIEASYSVDLTFRYLPSLYKLAAARASADPLVTELQKLADTWPLSGVGIPASEIRGGNVTALLHHPGHLQLYVDRIIEAKAFDLITETRLRQAVKAACR